MNNEPAPDAAGSATEPEPAPRLPFPVVGVGASAGGLEAFSEFLAAVPPGSGMAFVLIQHLPPDRESLMAEILARRTRMPVIQISDGLAVEADHVYVIRPGYTPTLQDGVLRLGAPLEAPGHRHPVDDFFRSLAGEQRARAIGIIMSGMGTNGTAGAEAIRAAGGLCIAQDPTGARFPSMPQSLLDSGVADLVLPIGEIPAALARYGTHPYVREAPAVPEDSSQEQVLREILQLLRARIRHDFTNYKKPTLLRRIARRMGVRQIATIAEYQRTLLRDPAEVSALADDLLIHITAFFRDPAIWESLREKVVAPLVAAAATGSSIRGWVTACASGEEAYSLAMLLLEAAGAAEKRFEIKIFATDIADRPLDRGRNAVYPASIESDISPERLARFFDKLDGSYRVRKELRESVVFASQNLLQDPPFSRLDVCSCRNLLIYLEPEMQKRALALLHFALRDGGFLLLGSSETLGVADELFEPLDKKCRIFRRRGGARREAMDFSASRPSLPGEAAPEPGRPLARASIVHLTRQVEPAPPAAPAGAAPVNGRAELEQELLRARDELQGKILELQSNNEEMKASHEETITINEELQSTNEELETSKEELQSLNEELTTVNAQLQVKMEELEAMTNDLSGLLSSTNIAVVFLDSQFRIRRYTPAVRDLLDLIPADIGRPLHNLARKFTDARLLEDAKAVLDTLVPVRQEIASASGRTYIRSVLPYRSQDDRIDGVVLTFVDITERKETEAALRESEEQHRLMLESLKEYAIFMLDAAGVIVSWPKSAERMLGYSRSEALGRPLSLVLPPEEGEPGVAGRELEEARAKGSFVHEGWRIRRDGSRFWGTGALSAVLDGAGQLRGFVKVLRDNTDRKLAEQSLQLAKQKAEAANEAKDQFLATVSHELRTPLSSIVLWANLIDENEPIDKAQLAEVMAAIKRGAAEQRELIEDLVDTARIATGKLRLQIGRVDLAGLAEAAAASFVFAAEEKNLRLETEFDPAAGIVAADPVRLKQVMNNLLANAVKFTPPGGRIAFSLRRTDGEVIIRVIDTGQGFPPDFGARLFTRFEQAQHSGSRAQGGLGIGLSIARQIVSLHGGSISGESAGAGRGAAFTVRLSLPVLTGEAEPPAPPAAPDRIPPVLQHSRVLLLEDAPDTQKALVAVLQEAGAVVRPTDSARIALEEFERQRPDLIVSDLGLPEMDGYEFMSAIRLIEADRRAPPIPALALTAFAGENDARRALECGFSRCLNKPIEPAQLIGALVELRRGS